MSIERKPSALERKLILAPIRAHIKRKYNIKVLRNDTIGLKPPYVILANHVTNWDPLFLNCYVDESIAFVAAASSFQSPMLQKVLNYAGAIPKAKSKSDSSTVRNIIKAIKHDRVVGIFPEGNRTWNGQTEPLVFATAKLIKSLKVPVVVVNIKGGYLSHPRWADTVRKGKVTLEFKQVFDKETLASLKPEEVFKQLSEELHVDDFAWQKQSGVLFEGEQLANYLERYLFTCPNCSTVGELVSKSEEFTCNACQYKVRYTNIGTFAEVQQPVKFEYIYDWNHWQLAHMQEHIEDDAYRASIAKALQEKLTITKMTKDDVVHKLGQYNLNVGEDTLEFASLSSEAPIRLQIENIEGANIFKQTVVNFLYEGEQYHLYFENERISAYLFIQYIECLKQQLLQ